MPGSILYVTLHLCLAVKKGLIPNNQKGRYTIIINAYVIVHLLGDFILFPFFIIYWD